MDSNSRIYVAGRDTLVGRALLKRLATRGFTRVVHDAEPDLSDRREVSAFFERVRPEFVFLTAGKVSGIAGNQQWPADLMIDNLRAASTVVPAAWESQVRKLLYLGSSCVYPKAAPQPFNVSSLGSGPMEATSQAYAVAKLAGMKCARRIGASTMPRSSRRSQATRTVPAMISASRIPTLRQACCGGFTRPV